MVETGFRILAFGVNDLPTVDLGDTDCGDSSLTILIGANGTGKSMALAALAQTFADSSLPRSERRSSDRRQPRPFALKELRFRCGADRYDVTFDENGVAEIHCDGSSGSGGIPVPNRVIAMTISPFDKFPTPRPGRSHEDGAGEIYVYSGPRGPGGRSSVLSLLYNALDNLTQLEDGGRIDFAGLADVFKFVGFSPFLSFKYRRSSGTHRLWAAARNFANAPNELAEELGRLQQSFNVNHVRLHRLALEAPDHLEQLALALSRVDSALHRSRRLKLNVSLRYEMHWDEDADLVAAVTYLRRSGLLDLEGVDVRKISPDRRIVDLRDASSGELSLLINFLSLAATIDDSSLVLIDEPELSLHPAWQRSYVSLLLKTFSHYRGCHYIIATHSPPIVGGAPRPMSQVINLDRSVSPDPDREFFGESSDYLLVNAFGTATDQNYYIRDLLSRALSMMFDGEIASSEFGETVAKLAVIRPLLSSRSPVGQAIDQLIAARHAVGQAND